MFANGPAAGSFNSSRFSFYGVTATPTVKIDGQNAAYSPSTFTNAINNRLAVPADVSISVNMVGDASGGTAYIDVTAEVAPPSGVIKVYSVITEDHEIATSAWGYYSGKEMMWIPVAFPLPNAGRVLNFTGPYPQTLQVSGSYTLTPSQHIFDNLSVATFVQTSTKTVLNASFVDLPDTGTGIYGDELSTIDLHAWPSPTTGSFSVSAVLPAGVTGSVEIFDITGRSVEQFDAGSVENHYLQETGVYFIRLTTSSGEIVRKQIAVIK